MKRWKNWAVYAIIDLFMYLWVAISLGWYGAACYRYGVITGFELSLILLGGMAAIRAVEWLDMGIVQAKGELDERP